jgi:hypothetical protein
MAHPTHEQLQERIQKAQDTVKVGAKYIHYKNPNNQYEVVAVGFLEATEEPCVIYKALYGTGFTWVRSFNDWDTDIETENGTVKRFKKVSN